jgi:hypothetical protein
MCSRLENENRFSIFQTIKHNSEKNLLFIFDEIVAPTIQPNLTSVAIIIKVMIVFFFLLPLHHQCMLNDVAEPVHGQMGRKAQTMQYAINQTRNKCADEG